MFHIGQEWHVGLRLPHLQPLQGVVVAPELIEQPYIAFDVTKECIDAISVSAPVEFGRNCAQECDFVVNCPLHVSRIISQLLPHRLILHKVVVRMTTNFKRQACGSQRAVLIDLASLLFKISDLSRRDYRHHFVGYIKELDEFIFSRFQIVGFAGRRR
jgi:hypothetical protein